MAGTKLGRLIEMRRPGKNVYTASGISSKDTHMEILKSKTSVRMATVTTGCHWWQNLLRKVWHYMEE